MTNPLITVIIPVYNAGEYLLSAVESIVGQTYKNLEIFIVDDGSSDNCIESIRDISDDRIVLVEQENTGKAMLINRLLPNINGKYYLIQDADDISYSERIETLVGAMEEDDSIGLVFSGYDLIINNKKLAPSFCEKDTAQCKKDISKFTMPSHDPTAMFRVSLVRDLRYDPKFKIGQGFDYILRVAEKNSAKVVGKCLYSYRINFASNTRASAERRLKMESRVVKEARKRRGLDYRPYVIKFKNRHRHRVLESGIVPHCMESVIDCKKKKKFGLAFKTAIRCACLHLFDYYYYKPLAYFFVPIGLISWYRLKKIKE